MRLSVSFAACLWGACAAASLTALPVSAQPAAPAQPAVPAAPALSPLQGASAALDHAHAAKTLVALNPYLSRKSAAFLGFTLVLGDSLISGMATALSPKASSSPAASAQAASEKAFQKQVDALLNRYSLNDKTLKMSGKSDDLPPALITRGHQFLTDAFTLSDAYEKSHASAKSRTIGSQISGGDLPLSSQCTFHVLSPTRVQIAPRSNPKSSFDALLEDGQWRIDMMGLTNSSAPSKPKRKTITPQAAAFLKAIDDDDAASVAQKLKVNPALANLPPSYYKGNSGDISDLPLMSASFHGNIQVVTLLIQSGAKVNVADEFGQSPLEQAARFGNKEVVAILLAHGANIAHRNDFGKTALHEAVAGDNASTVASLLAHGANVNARDEDRETPLTLALDPSNQGMDRAAIIKLLRQHGAKK